MSWTKERHARLVELAANGLSPRQMAADLGVTRNAVIGRCHREDVPIKAYERKPRAPRPPREPRQCWRYPDAVVLRVRELYAEGRSYADISDMTGATVGSIGYLTSALPRRHDTHRTAAHDFAFRVAAVAATLAGESFAKAAVRLDCSQSSILKWKRLPAVLAAAQPLAERIRAKWEADQAETARLEAEAAAEARALVDAQNAPLFAQMPHRDANMLRRRVDGETCAAIARDYGISRERVRQIEVTWRLKGLLVPCARPLNGAAARRLMLRLHRAPPPMFPAAVVSPTADPLTPYWRAKVEQAAREHPPRGEAG